MGKTRGTLPLFLQSVFIFGENVKVCVKLEGLAVLELFLPQSSAFLGFSFQTLDEHFDIKVLESHFSDGVLSVHFFFQNLHSFCEIFLLFQSLGPSFNLFLIFLKQSMFFLAGIEFFAYEVIPGVDEKLFRLFIVADDFIGQAQLEVLHVLLAQIGDHILIVLAINAGVHQFARISN